MIEDILPVAVMAAEAYADVPADPLDPATLLFPEEAAALARAVPSRQREYATARTCARRAMGALGMPPAPLVTGARGALELGHCRREVLPGHRRAPVVPEQLHGPGRQDVRHLSCQVGKTAPSRRPTTTSSRGSHSVKELTMPVTTFFSVQGSG
ncbi:4'-phosphopantetheinyl transferase Svp [Streptomyces xanthophaeus]|uniref:hypothetical protein n=1 Tax=Streptomyces xanthophaeus TaxID=67385 RepID=UPI00233E95C1|nr:hypothetical protein [Streptomyces xanthophaeus]WCD84288.1 4'-phosphopantetheinyl transferase Svp [Streptomyces xanthophaeus]